MDSVEVWETSLAHIENLTNLEIAFKENLNLSILLEDISEHERWLILFGPVVAFRFKKSFHMSRLANTFKVAESSWIAELEREPMLLPGELDRVQHFLIDTLSGEIEILSSKEPRIRKQL